MKTKVNIIERTLQLRLLIRELHMKLVMKALLLNRIVNISESIMLLNN